MSERTTREDPASVAAFDVAPELADLPTDGVAPDATPDDEPA